MTDAPNLSSAIALVDWLCAPPHTIEMILGIYGEVAAHQGRELPSGLTASELAQWIGNSSAGTSDRSDPVTREAMGTSEDPAVQTVDAAIAQLAGLARDLDDHACTMAGQPLWRPTERKGRTEILRDSTTRLHHARSLGLEDHDRCGGDLHPMWERAYCETASWLHAKALGIWKAAKGETHQVAEQKSLAECSCCGRWRKGTIAAVGGRCTECDNFKRNVGVLPTEPIVRRWDVGKAATPGQIMEAKAPGKRKAKAG